MIAQINAMVPEVRYIFDTVDHSVNLVAGGGLAGSIRMACVRLWIMHSISPAVMITTPVNFHHITIILTRPLPEICTKSEAFAIGQAVL